MKLLMIEDNKSVSEMMKIFFFKKKIGILILHMMAMRHSRCSALILKVGI